MCTKFEINESVKDRLEKSGIEKKKKKSELTKNICKKMLVVKVI